MSKVDYSVDWRDVRNIQDAAQVVDGKWQLVKEGVRSVRPGYDRLIAIGDISWQDYEVVTTVTIHRLDFDNVGPVSGSGPAYLFLFAECLEKAAIAAGLPEDEVEDLVAQTIFGSARLLLESPEPASALRAQVTSPGGTTEAALKTLGERGFEQSVIAAVLDALKRAGELGGVKKV